MDQKLATSLEQLEKQFASRMQEYEDKLKKVSAGNAPSTALNIAALSSEFSDFKAFVVQTFTTIKTQIELLALGLDRHETIMRKKVLLFHGIAENKDEKLRSVVADLLTDKMKLSGVSEGNLQVCHRLGPSQTKTRPILVRFYNTEHRNTVWENKTALKGSGITISEFLTKARHRIFMTARQHFGLHRCWTVDGKIVVMVSEKARRKIESMTELLALLEEFPSTAAAADVERSAGHASQESKALPTAVAKRTRRR